MGLVLGPMWDHRWENIMSCAMKKRKNIVATVKVLVMKRDWSKITDSGAMGSRKKEWVGRKDISEEWSWCFWKDSATSPRIGQELNFWLSKTMWRTPDAGSIQKYESTNGPTISSGLSTSLYSLIPM
eukprot:CAMPEP_0118644966 /NCGR_PEP_ID=MMETSP0785-20121206/7240_1 /TAXON_ID=91992 /ORGANISM="Bolidomonas pacifica, Strain CCMP 1866" /LENGTH=126 /DNA_ID=CAMNT_0006536799 /DNA_START=256 /DNA_END=636 /DNA_ORIENTATION=+